MREGTNIASIVCAKGYDRFRALLQIVPQSHTRPSRATGSYMLALTPCFGAFHRDTWKDCELFGLRRGQHHGVVTLWSRAYLTHKKGSVCFEFRSILRAVHWNDMHTTLCRLSDPWLPRTFKLNASHVVTTWPPLTGECRSSASLIGAPSDKLIIRRPKRISWPFDGVADTEVVDGPSLIIGRNDPFVTPRDRRRQRGGVSIRISREARSLTRTMLLLCSLPRLVVCSMTSRLVLRALRSFAPCLGLVSGIQVPSRLATSRDFQKHDYVAYS